MTIARLESRATLCPPATGLRALVRLVTTLVTTGDVNLRLEKCPVLFLCVVTYVPR